jgi:hypothetical protein
MLAASVGEDVVLVIPGGEVKKVPTGPVAWLFPAPGGRLYAPDLVHQRTSLIDVATGTVSEELDGISMPRFGMMPDRYLVVGRDLLVVSYPDRAPIARVEVGLDSPWQVIVTPDDMAVIVLDRRRDDDVGIRLVGVDLVHHQVSFRVPLEADVVRMAMSMQLGVLALANRTAGSVDLYRLATLEPLVSLPLESAPEDLVFAGDPEVLAVVRSTGAAGELCLWRLKVDKTGSLMLKKDRRVALPSPPRRLVADPWSTRLAVVGEDAVVRLFEAGSRHPFTTLELPGVPRDVVWFDPHRSGPMLPEWSDGKPRPLSIAVPPTH